MGDLENLLKAGDEGYQREDEDEPIGPSFMMQLQNAELCVSSTGKVMIKRHHLIIEGEYEGVSVYDNLFPVAAGFAKKRFKQWCAVMDVEPPETSMDIEETVAEIVAANPVYIAGIAKSGEYRNVNITKLVDVEDAPNGAKKSGGSKKTKKGAEPEETEDEPADEITKGDTVTFTNDEDEEVTGTVTKIKNGKADIDAPDADYEAVSVDSLSAVEEEPEEDGEPEEDEELNDLIALAQANDIEVNDDTERDDLVKTLKAHKWDKDELADDEVELLEGVGVKFKKPAPKAKKTKKAKKKTKRR